MSLPYDRFLNLAQHALMLTLSEEEQQRVSTALAAPAPVFDAARDPDAPDWWFGDDEAYAYSMAGAQRVGGSG